MGREQPRRDSEKAPDGLRGGRELVWGWGVPGITEALRKEWCIMAAVTSYHKPSGIKQYRLRIL